MALICIQCAIKALALGEPLPGPTDETPEAHVARVHPDHEQTQKDRAAWERAIAARRAFDDPDAEPPTYEP